jgi:lysophospholipid acyltransferase (LPLAT)-like uncharacterized protein
MSLSRRLLSSPAVQALLVRLVAAYVNLVWATCRWEFRGLEHPEPFWRDQRSLIGAFWHGRLLMMPKLWRGRTRLHMLISQSRDGELIARTVERLGIATIRGSTAKKGGRDKGGAAAVRAIMTAVRAGESIGFTPDGPKGPRMRASDGVVTVARLTGCPVFCATYSSTPALRLGSWDRFHLPLPFGRGVFIVAPPLPVPEDGDAGALRRAVEDTLNRLTREADEACGRAPVEPAGETVHAAS